MGGKLHLIDILPSSWFLDYYSPSTPQNEFMDDERYLELKRLSDDGVTLKVLSDNLKNYPTLVLFWLAISFLWNGNIPHIPGMLTTLIAAVWAPWILLVNWLTAMQSGVLFVKVLIDIFPIVKRNEYTKLAGAIAATFFMFSTMMIALAISSLKAA